MLPRPEMKFEGVRKAVTFRERATVYKVDALGIPAGEL